MASAPLVPSQELADELYPPTDIGPVWAKDDDGNWILPEYTIGYDIIDWAESRLGSIDGTTDHLEFTPEQMRLLLWMYAVDEHGHFRYRKTVFQAFKGAGKDPYAAVLALIEFIGPSQFSHWEGDVPIGKAHPRSLVHLLAVSKEQNRNTMDIIPALITKELIAEYHLDVQKEQIYAPGGRRLQMVGSSFRSIEGRRPTFSLFNETQHWLSSNGGHHLYQTESRNLTKTGGRVMMITNAYQPGADSIAERVREREEKVWAGLLQPSGWLYHSREAHPKAPLSPEWLPFIMERIIGDSYWWRSKMEILKNDVMDAASMSAAEARQMFYNQIVSSENAFFTKDEIDGAQLPGCLGDERDLKHGDEITLGFDGSKTDDATALVAVRIRDRLIVPLHVQQKPTEALDWRVDEEAVDEAVKAAFANYKVKAFFADVAYWESYISKWVEEFGEHLEVSGTNSKIGFDMRGNKEKIARAFEAFHQAIVDKLLRHNGNGFFRMHALNAHRSHNGAGITAKKAKPDSPHKIDTMISAYIAYTALTTWLEKGKKKPDYKRTMLRSSQNAGY